MKAYNPRIADYEDFIRIMAVELEFTDKILALPFNELRAYVEDEMSYGAKKSHDDDGCNEKEEIIFNEAEALDDMAESAGYGSGCVANHIF